MPQSPSINIYLNPKHAEKSFKGKEALEFFENYFIKKIFLERTITADSPSRTFIISNFNFENRTFDNLVMGRSCNIILKNTKFDGSIIKNSSLNILFAEDCSFKASKIINSKISFDEAHFLDFSFSLIKTSDITCKVSEFKKLNYMAIINSTIQMGSETHCYKMIVSNQTLPSENLTMYLGGIENFTQSLKQFCHQANKTEKTADINHYNLYSAYIFACNISNAGPELKKLIENIKTKFPYALTTQYCEFVQNLDNKITQAVKLLQSIAKGEASEDVHHLHISNRELEKLMQQFPSNSSSATVSTNSTELALQNHFVNEFKEEFSRMKEPQAQLSNPNKRKREELYHYR